MQIALDSAVAMVYFAEDVRASFESVPVAEAKSEAAAVKAKPPNTALIEASC